MLAKQLISVAVLWYCAAVATSTDESTIISIPLNKSITNGDKQLYGEFMYLNNATTLQLNFTNVNPDIAFIIIQVHTHLYNVTLYKNTVHSDSKAWGTNIGLYYDLTLKSKDTFFIYNPNLNVDLKMFITVHGYWNIDPIPGGCSIEGMHTFPYLTAIYNKEYIYVDAALSRSPEDNNDKDDCTIIEVKVALYVMYMPERNFDSDSYFEGIQSMLTLDNILKNGRLIPETNWLMRRMVGAYPGTGAVFVGIATYNNATAVYVPTHTYGCSPLGDDCDLLDDLLSRFMCALLLFLGLFICYFGHRFFKTEMFLVGLISGVIITYIVISLNAELDRPALIVVSALSGVFFGAIWLLFWWFYGLPVFSVLLSSMNLGFMIASIIFYLIPGGFKYLQEDLYFWTIFIMTMLLVSVTLVSMTFIASIQCCAILGAYAALYPMDYALGSNLKYILTNTIRRAIVPNFNYAVLMPIFQWKDCFVTLAWVVLAGSGFLVQFYRNRNRPPFPPPPRNVRPSMVDHPSFFGATVAPTMFIRRLTQHLISSPRRPSVVGERTPLLA